METLVILLPLLSTHTFALSSFLYNHKKFNFFFDLDDEIVESIFQPRSRDGDILLENIDLYNRCLITIIKMVKTNDPNVLHACRDFLDRRGPRCLHGEFDVDSLRIGFRWTDAKLVEFLHLTEDMKGLWAEFKTAFVLMKPRELYSNS